MNKIKLDILDKGGKVFYMDTDSIITNIPLSDNLLGNKLGQLKLEHYIQAWLAAREPEAEGYFISAKTYGFINDKNKIIIKCKGVDSDSLNLDDFRNMLNNKEDITANKNYTKMDYKEGSVSFLSKNITLNYDSYTAEREKRKNI